MGRFKFLQKELNSYSRSNFDDIYQLTWDYKLNKPIIINPKNQGELRLLELAEKYYLFLVDQNRWEDDKANMILPKDEDEKLNVICDEIKEGNVIVALTDDGHIKGYCRYTPNEKDKSIYIEVLFTVAEYQHQGIATELLEYVEKIAISKYNIKLMMNSVHTKNTGAIKFYNKFGLIEPKDVMYSVAPEYSTYVYKEVEAIWKNNYSFVDGSNEDPLKWYNYIVAHKGNGNCPDYGMYVAYIASKFHKAKVAIAQIGLTKNTQTSQQSYSHILPIYYEDGNWVLVNYVGTDGPSEIKTFAGDDSIETVTRFITKYFEIWLPLLGEHVGMDYNSCDKIIKIADNRRVTNTLNRFYGQNVSQNEVLNYLFNTDRSIEELIMDDDIVQSKEDYSPKKRKYSKNNKKEVTGRRRFKCEDCGQRFGTFDQLFNHAVKMHSDEIGDEDPYKYLFDKRNPGQKLCVICKKNPCEWNPAKHKYARYCTNPECKKKAREMFQKNMKRVYGTDNLLNDPEHQAEMLANRKISGKFTWTDGVQIVYVGKYELDFLQHCEANGFTSTDVYPFPTEKAIKYMDTFTNTQRFYIPDFWIPALNLAIEIKDGSKYPIDSKAKMAMKEAAVIKLNEFNFIKVVDKDYKDFDDLVKTLKDLNCAEKKSDTNHIFIIPAPPVDSL